MFSEMKGNRLLRVFFQVNLWRVLLPVDPYLVFLLPASQKTGKTSGRHDRVNVSY